MPTPAETVLQTALWRQKRGELKEAAELYKEVLALDRNNFDAHQLLGLCYFQGNEFSLALAHLNAALATRRDIASVFNNRGLVLKALRQFSDALSDFDQAIKLNKGFADAYYNKANTLVLMRRHKEAIRLFESACELQPQNTRYLNNLASCWAELGNHATALELYRQLITRNNHDLSARLNLAHTLLALNRREEALAAYSEVINLHPQSVEAYAGRGDVLRELGRLDEALSDCQEAVRLSVTSAEAHCSYGNVLSELGRHGEALVSYREAIRLKPDYSAAYNSCGVALKELARADEAIACYDKAIALRPDYAEAYSNRGNALKEVNRLDEAVASYNEAISLKPGYALAWSGLAQVDSEAGRFTDADVKFQKARSLDPKLVAPLCGIANIRKFDSSDPLIREMEDLLSTASLPDRDRAELYHAYGKICNDVGRYDEAFLSYSRGKDLLTAKFDTAAYGEAYSAMKHLFTPEFFAERTAFGVEDARPVFVVGMPRSGTTLTEQVLAGHRLVEGLGELPHLHRIANEIAPYVGHPERFADAVRSLRASDVARMADRYRETYAGTQAGKLRLVDKMPHNFQHLGLIAMMFPRAHIIHCRRSPLDNCVSIYMQNYIDKHHYAKDLTILGQHYRQYEDLMKHWAEVLPVRIHECSYEALVGDFEGSVRGLLSYLELDWDTNCLRFQQQDRQVRTASLWQVRQPLYGTSVNRWQRYEPHLGPLKEALSAG